MGRIALFAVLAAMGCGTAMAQPTGELEYMDSCATCHGTEGLGDGPLADLMTVEVPPLTGLTAANGGEFPLQDVIMYIDGRTGVRGHGYPMPVWGSRYKAEVEHLGQVAAELETRGRILLLAQYLESIQD